jgi:hypothetical protein
MLTALALALVLGQPAQGCATCGANHNGAEEGATGWFPLNTPTGWHRIWNMCTGPVIGLGANKCPCPLGVPVPYGDTWAMQMHANYSSAAPTSAPTPPPPPTPAANRPADGATAPPAPGAAPDSARPASPFETPAPSTPLTPLP